MHVIDAFPCREVSLYPLSSCVGFLAPGYHKRSDVCHSDVGRLRSQMYCGFHIPLSDVTSFYPLKRCASTLLMYSTNVLSAVHSSERCCSTQMLDVSDVRCG